MQQRERHISRIKSTFGNGLKSFFRFMSVTSPFHSFSLSVKDSPVQKAANLEALFEQVLMDFRITLHKYDIEVLYTPLAQVYCNPEKAEQFFRLAIGRVVQFARKAPPVVTIEGQIGPQGYNVVLTASQNKSEKLMIIGRFGNIIDQNKEVVNL